MCGGGGGGGGGANGHDFLYFYAGFLPSIVPHCKIVQCIMNCIGCYSTIHTISF